MVKRRNKKINEIVQTGGGSVGERAKAQRRSENFHFFTQKSLVPGQNPPGQNPPGQNPPGQNPQLT